MLQAYGVVADKYTGEFAGGYLARVQIRYAVRAESAACDNESVKAGYPVGVQRPARYFDGGDVWNAPTAKHTGRYLGRRQVGYPGCAELPRRYLPRVKRRNTRGIELATGCLLYTSPSPRDRQKSRMPSSA